MGMSRAAFRATQHSRHPTPSGKGKPTPCNKQGFQCNTSFFFFLFGRLENCILYSQVLAFGVTVPERFTDEKTGVCRAFQQVNYLISSRIPVLKRLRSDTLNAMKHHVKFSRCLVCTYEAMIPCAAASLPSAFKTSSFLLQQLLLREFSLHGRTHCCSPTKSHIPGNSS